MLHEDALRVAQSTDNKAGPETGATAWLGLWRNQMGSTMELEVDGDEISGVYTSADSGKSGTGPVTSRKLRGYVCGDLISFQVLWPGGSITSWTGQLVDDASAPRIKTLWHLVTDVPDPDEPLRFWTSTIAGADEFRR